jgi:hypothetical protein
MTLERFGFVPLGREPCRVLSRFSRACRELEPVVKQSLGFLLQMAVLMFLPMVIGWQLFFGFPLIVMPAALLAATLVFALGHALRSSR